MPQVPWESFEQPERTRASVVTRVLMPNFFLVLDTSVLVLVGVAVAAAFWVLIMIDSSSPSSCKPPAVPGEKVRGDSNT
jgi:hypothetical protein